MSLRQQEIQQRIPLVFGDIIPIPLRECEQALMPQQGQLVFDGFEAKEVEDESVDHFVWQGVFLADEHLDEHAGGTGVVHFAEAKERGGGVEDGNGDAGED